MRGQRSVAPEHLMLAFAQRGNVELLLREREASASDIYAAIARADGLGDDLLLGRVPQSQTADRVLERAVDVAGERGVRKTAALTGTPALSARRSRRRCRFRSTGSRLDAAAVETAPSPGDPVAGTGFDETLATDDERVCAETASPRFCLAFAKRQPPLRRRVNAPDADDLARVVCWLAHDE
jgi:hypothetical protein